MKRTSSTVESITPDQGSQRPLLCIGDARLDAGLHTTLVNGGWAPVWINSIAAAQREARSGAHRIGLLLANDVSVQECDLMKKLICADRHCEWVAVVSSSALQRQSCIDLIVGYFFDHHTLPINYQGLLHVLGHAVGRSMLQHMTMPTCSGPEASHPIIGSSHAIKMLTRQVGKVAATDAPVLISGESGSGKELVAHAIHQRSHRSTASFVAVNCGAISSTLIQAELFGAVRGAYTGAQRDRKGLLEAADKGTILLDEIADLPLDMQTNLLRFLQEGTITPVGSNVSLRLDVRIIAATNVNLLTAVEEGKFRRDLYYRLNVLPVQVPPLRDRCDDIIPLSESFFAKYQAEANPRVRGFSAAACRAMRAHDWPGNVRELINCVRRGLVMAEGRMITPADLGLKTAPGFACVDALGRIRIDAERVAVCEALSRTSNNITQAARALGISRMTLYRIVERHQIDLSATEQILR